jgi:zinc-ribbon domain
MFDEKRFIPIVVPELAPVAQELAARFKAQGYDVDAVQTGTGGWDVSISQGGTFKAVLGMKTALKLLITAIPGGTSAQLSVGIFGRQALPFAIAMLVTWPVLVTEAWGLVRQYKLDHEVMEALETILRSHVAAASVTVAVAVAAAPAVAPGAAGQRFCTECGAEVSAGAHFCAGCGRPLAA